MYRYSNGRIGLSDFQQPMGMHLREDNRWVKKAQSIPWDKIESKCADLFPSETGNVAKPLQFALGACLIQREFGYSDVETVLQSQENPYLQYFCGYAGYDDSKSPFDASSMVHFRKRLTPEMLFCIENDTPFLQLLLQKRLYHTQSRNAPFIRKRCTA